MILCDFHIHSTYSDGKLTIPELIDYYGKRRFGAIAITDHLCEENTFLGKTAHLLSRSLRKNNFQSYLDEIQREALRARKEYDMVVIPGIEITKNSFKHADSAHILCLNINEFVDPHQSIQDVCAQTRSQGGLAVAAHPVSTRSFEPQTYYLWSNRDKLSQHFDAWEVASGAIMFDEVFHSGLPMIANSDFHRPSHMTSWKTMIHAELNTESLIAGVKEQNIDFYFYKEEKYEHFPINHEGSLEWISELHKSYSVLS